MTDPTRLLLLADAARRAISSIARLQELADAVRVDLQTVGEIATQVFLDLQFPDPLDN